MQRREVLTGIALAGIATALPSSLKARPTTPLRRNVPDLFTAIPAEDQDLGGLLGERMRTNLERQLLTIDEGVYLKGHVERAGIPRPAWSGEHVGKWLDAACRVILSTGHPQLRAKVDRVVAALVATQAPDGYLGTYPDRLRWTSWDLYVHNYVLLGLLSYYELSGNAAVLASCRRTGDLLSRTFGDGPGQRPITFNASVAPGSVPNTLGGIESTLILEAICRLYLHTSDPEHLAFARYIVSACEAPGAADPRKPPDVSHIALGKDYEYLANQIGLIDLYRITGERALLDAVLRNWEVVRTQQLYVTGTTGSKENFQPPGKRLSLFSSNVGENCTTVTWLQLNLRLLHLTGEPRFGQEIERTVFNHLLAAHDPETGGFGTSTSLTGWKRAESGPTCCVGSGMRALAHLPETVWAQRDDGLLVNMIAPGRARFRIGDTVVQLTSETDFPRSGEAVYRIEPSKPCTFALQLRVPEWAQHFEARIGEQTLRGKPGTILRMSRTWERGDEVRIWIDLAVRVIPGAPTYPDEALMARGPQVLVLEKSLNSDVPWLHRTALTSLTPALQELKDPPGWRGRQVYAVSGLVGTLGQEGKINVKAGRLVFVPFADAIEYRAWVALPGRLRQHVPAITAYGLALAQPRLLRPGVPAFEAISDEDPHTYCDCDPTAYSLEAVRNRRLGARTDPVSFFVTANGPFEANRIVFRHGRSTESGGWFDTSAGKPRISVVRKEPTRLGDKRTYNLYSVEWEDVGLLDAYPASTAGTPPKLEPGEALEFRLPTLATIYAIRITGLAGGSHASCGEFAAYA